jgi:hypothetical protein
MFISSFILIYTIVILFLREFSYKIHQSFNIIWEKQIQSSYLCMHTKLNIPNHKNKFLLKLNLHISSQQNSIKQILLLVSLALIINLQMI